MIGIDFSSFAINTITGNLEEKDLDGKADALPLIRHVILTSLLSIKAKYKAKFGNEIVFAVDNKTKPYWRKSVNPYYKGTRKESREKSKYDWTYIFDCMSTVKAELIENFPYKVIEVEGAEADDVIAVLLRYVQENRKVREGLIEAPEPFLIVSADGDYVQLHKFDGVEQHSPKKGSLITVKSIKEVNESLLTKIIKGDAGDGICNILSEPNCLVDKIRQKAVSTEKFLNPLLENSDHSWLTKEQQERMRINRILIDFDYIPQDIREGIVEAYNSYEVKGSKTKVFNYLIKNRLKVLFTRVDEF